MAEEDVDEMVTITSFPSERMVREAAKTLVERGVGAVIARGVPEETGQAPEPADGMVTHRNTDEYVATFELKVMHHQVATACEVLNLELPPETVAELAEAAKAPTPWKRILIIWAIAMLVIPVAAGFVSFWLVSR